MQNEERKIVLEIVNEKIRSEIVILTVVYILYNDVDILYNENENSLYKKASWHFKNWLGIF